jgi:tetratricopeptide (TPR) repeat protein
VYFSQQKLDQAEDILKETIAVNSKIEITYLQLSQLYQNKNDSDKSKSILIAGNENIPKSIKIPLMLASLYDREKDYDKAISVYKGMYELHPKNPLVMNNLASMLSDYGNNKDDMELAKSLADTLVESEQPVVLDTVGWVYFKAGDYKKAIDSLSRAVEKAADINIFNYHLGMAYKMDGNKEQAKVYLEKSLANGKPYKQKDHAESILKEL